VEIIVEGKRRRNWPKELKRRIVEESYGPDVSVCDVARRHDLDPAQLFAWRKMFRERASPPVSFVPVTVEACASAPVSQKAGRLAKHKDKDVTTRPEPLRIEIALPNGRHLFAPAQIDPKLLSRLVAVLDGA